MRKYKIGDIVIYNDELRGHGASSNKYLINNIVYMNSQYSRAYYVVECLYNDREKVLLSPNVECNAFEINTELDKAYIRETKLNKLL
jgi:hypothetical protein